MYDQANNKFIATVRQHIPQNENLVQMLSSTLSLGKVAVYRRLRGEVPFTLNEVVTISLKLGISLDKMIGTNDAGPETKWAILDLDTFFTSENYYDRYSERLSAYLQIYKAMQNSKKVNIRAVENYLSATFMLRYDTLSRFRLFKWLYLAQGVKPDFRLSDVVKPAKILKLEKEFVSETLSVPRIMTILDRNIFACLVNDINYFYKRGLVDDNERALLKKELLDTVSFMELLAEKGYFNTRTEFTIYLSDVTLDSSYIHFEYDSHSYCLQYTYFIDTLTFHNSLMSQKHKEWIESLKRYSVLITQSGESERFSFFNQQRQLIKTAL